MIGQYYTMSPQSDNNIYIVSKTGLGISTVDNSKDYDTVPIISLNSKAIVIHGDGSQESPYEIRTDSNDVVKDCATNVYKKGTILNKMLSSDCAYSANKKSKNVARLDGINFNDIKNIWNKYYHNELKHKRNTYGTGLGLSIVKTILESHGYKYGVNSSKGNGTMFYFEINRKN